MSTEMTTQKPLLTEKFAANFGVEASKLLPTLKATAFKLSGSNEVSNEQMMALLIVADQYHLNPFTKEIFAFPDSKGGIVPVVGVDGWARIINEHPQFDGMDFEQDAEGCTCRIHRKDRSHPVTITEYMGECKRETGPWKTHPRRMLRHKALIQCARIAFGFAGIYDQDEAERIVEGEVVERQPFADNDIKPIGWDVIDKEKVSEAIIRAVEIVDSDDMHEGPVWADELYSTLTSGEAMLFMQALKDKKGGATGRKSYWSMFLEYKNFTESEPA